MGSDVPEGFSKELSDLPKVRGSEPYRRRYEQDCEYQERDPKLRRETWGMSRSIVKLAELKRACKRLLARMSDECDSSNHSVIFTADRDYLRIQIGGSSETISAAVLQTGRESLPCSLFWDMTQTLRFYRKKKVGIVVSDSE